MFFFKKKKEQTKNIQEAKPDSEQPKQSKNVNAISKDNYGEQDDNENFVNTAGKIGKANHNYFSQLDKVEAMNGNRAISSEAQSPWLSLNGTVYDVTNYMRYHPGGKLILQGCGKECSDLFNKYHPWVNGDYLLKKYKLGYLAG